MAAPIAPEHTRFRYEPVTIEPAVPRWVRLCDIAALTTLALSAAVLVGGGFRIRTEVLRVAVTSPETPAILGVLLLVLRHVAYPEPSLVARLGRSGRRLRASDAWKAAWPPFAITRLAVLVVGLFAVLTIGYGPTEPAIRSSDNELLNLPMRWDAGWYYRIARVGYEWDRRAEGQQNIAFFPLYPIAVRLLGRVLGASNGAYVLAGLLISHAAFLWSLMLLYQLARATLGDDGAGRAAVMLLACYPFSIFHGALYTESLFLLGTLGAVLEIHRGRPGRAMTWGLLAGLTRPNGFLLSATLALIALARWRATRVPASIRQALPTAAVVVAPVVGVALYSLFIWQLTGNPLEWREEQSKWGREFEGAAPAREMVDAVGRDGVLAYVAANPYNVLNGIAATAAVALIVPVGLRLGLAYSVFLALNLLPPLALGGTMSMGRFTATMFPLFLWLAAAAPRAATPVAIAFAVLQGLAAVLFYTWRPLF